MKPSEVMPISVNKAAIEQIKEVPLEMHARFIICVLDYMFCTIIMRSKSACTDFFKICLRV